MKNLDRNRLHDNEITPELQHKLESLERILSELRSALVAFSGGVDSTFLLKVASKVLGKRLLAVTSNSDTLPSSEVDDAIKLAGLLGVRHQVVPTNEMCDPDFVSNPPDRCFHCKKVLFTELTVLAREHRLENVIEGSNYDDISDYRPGFRAVEQFRVRSPLREAGLTKAEIRILSKEMGLPTWDKPAAPCLSSRIPYGSKITPEKLRRIESAEKFLHGSGFRIVRVRDHDKVARIEVPGEDIPKLLDEKKARELTDKFKSLGYDYVTVDVRGYRMGSMNEPLKKERHE